MPGGPISPALIAADTFQARLLVSTVSTGTAPLTITSTTVVTNLNADKLDGQHGSYYQDAGNITAGTLANARLSGSYTGITLTGTLTSLTIIPAVSGVALTIGGGGVYGKVVLVSGSYILANTTTGFTVNNAGDTINLFSVSPTGGAVIPATLLVGPGTIATGTTLAMQISNAGAAGLVWRDTTAAADGKNWDMFVTGTTLRARVANDVYGSSTNWMVVTRSTTTVSDIALTGTTITLTGIVTVTNGLKVTGGALAAGSIYKDTSLGLVVAAVAGSADDFYLVAPAGGGIMHVPTGTATAVFDNALTAASYKVGSNQVTGARITGWGLPTGTLYRTALTNASTQAQFNQAIMALITDQFTHGMIGV